MLSLLARSRSRSRALAAASFSHSAALRRGWLRSLPGFGGASKSAPTGPTSLLKQEGIPEELRLPVPGDPMSRVGAGLVDLLIAGAAGASAGGVAHLVTGDAVVVGAAAQTAALGFWVLRDALSPDGNRSIGKRLFKLELAFWDGALPPTLLAAARNSYFLALPLSQLHPLLEMVWTLVLVFDISSILFTQDARKLGDYSFGTRVVDERPGREDRVRDFEERSEIEALRAEIKELTPNASIPVRATADAASSGPSAVMQPWYASVRQEVVGSDVIGTARKSASEVVGTDGGAQADSTASAAPALQTVSQQKEAASAPTASATSPGPTASDVVYLKHPPTKRRS